MVDQSQRATATDGSYATRGFLGDYKIVVRGWEGKDGRCASVEDRLANRRGAEHNESDRDVCDRSNSSMGVAPCRGGTSQHLYASWVRPRMQISFRIELQFEATMRVSSGHLMGVRPPRLVRFSVPADSIADVSGTPTVVAGKFGQAVSLHGQRASFRLNGSTDLLDPSRFRVSFWLSCDVGKIGALARHSPRAFRFPA